MAKRDQKMASFRWKMSRRLQKPISNKQQVQVDLRPDGFELHAPDPAVHARGSDFQESDKMEPGVVCPSCKSPAHARDTKCPWCGADIASLQ